LHLLDVDVRGSGRGEHFEALAIVHVLVSGRDTVDVGGGVEDLPRFDGAVEDVGHEFLDVGTCGCGAAGEADVSAEEAAETDGGVFVLGTPTRLMIPPGRTMPTACS
jgi:hypothetical protein